MTIIHIHINCKLNLYFTPDLLSKLSVKLGGRLPFVCSVKVCTKSFLHVFNTRSVYDVQERVTFNADGTRTNHIVRLRQYRYNGMHRPGSRCKIHAHAP